MVLSNRGLNISNCVKVELLLSSGDMVVLAPIVLQPAVLETRGWYSYVKPYFTRLDVKAHHAISNGAPDRCRLTKDSGYTGGRVLPRFASILSIGG